MGYNIGMRFDIVLAFFFIALVSMAFFHQLAIIFYLYWVYPWFDLTMHLLGGITIALGLKTVLFRTYVTFLPESILTTVLTVLVIGIAWEVFEWSVGIVDPSYIVDTSLDIAMDAIGGVCGYYLAIALKQHDSAA